MDSERIEKDRADIKASNERLDRLIEDRKLRCILYEELSKVLDNLLEGFHTDKDGDRDTHHQGTDSL